MFVFFSNFLEGTQTFKCQGDPLKAKSKREFTIYFTLDNSPDFVIVTIKGGSSLARNLLILGMAFVKISAIS